MQTTEDDWGAGISPLFSTEAPHNAEVMPEEEFRTVDQLWSVESTDESESNAYHDPDLAGVGGTDPRQADLGEAESIPTDAIPAEPIDVVPTGDTAPDFDETADPWHYVDSGNAGSDNIYDDNVDDDETVIIEAEIVDDDDLLEDTVDANNVGANTGFYSDEPEAVTFDEEPSVTGLFSQSTNVRDNDADNFDTASTFTQPTGTSEHDPWVVDAGPTDWSSPNPNLYDSDGTFIGGGVFSSEPVPEDHDVIDQVDDIEDDIPVEPEDEPWIPHHLQESGSQLFGGLANPVIEDDLEDTFDPFEPAPGLQPTPGDPWVSLEDTHDPDTDTTADASGSFDDAIERLSIDEQNRVEIPLAVVGSMLGSQEFVHGVVGGQMLGQPAVIVVTDSRVLVVNARRWRPIVDEYAVDGSLIVRGRHDKDVAALSFADPEKFSMVDDISDVELAIELADRIRSG